MNICFVFDNHYVGQFKVAAYSLFVNNPNEKITLHLLTYALEKKYKDDICVFLNHFNAEYVFYEIDESPFEGLPKMREHSYAPYYKLLIPKTLCMLNRVLLLDCDIIVCKPLHELYYASLNGLIAAVEDFYVEKHFTEHIGMVIGEKLPYFNSGVMLFDFQNQSHPELKEMIEYGQRSGRALIYHDQDVLNHFYARQCTFLDETYNFFSIYRSFFDIFRIKKRPAIVHYTGEKPWSDSYINKYFGLYKKYYRACAEITDIGFPLKRKYFFKPFFSKVFRGVSKKFGKNKAR